MPFTFSHPAAVLPLLRRGRARGPLVASALVAGSMAPDVPYFADSLIRGTFEYGTVTHSLWAIPTVDVAIAGALVAAWHGLLREPLTALLPDRWAAAVHTLTAPRRRGLRPADAGWFVLSAAVGAATHVGWDAFTHHDRAGVRLLPVLNRTVSGEPLFHLLQYGSSAVALVWLAVYAVRTTRRAAASEAASTETETETEAEAGPGAGPDPEPEPAPAAVPGTGGVAVAARPAIRQRRRPRLSGRARAGTAAFVTAAGIAGAVHRVARWTSLHGTTDSVADLVPTACFGAGTGLAAGLLLYAAAARIRSARQD
ncbi:DUF4184 family protein [Peterkaempfera bronchialis]|uniref:DUF4184 family protein n=1 Tax=Peterkaempfera bronchialis TaxID=2126346 RepID=A0A345SSH8_9ACTN|nr:DUF4184 family protein [Peterkaempfera bronchialis]AXI76683.1 DUF4184 family protein [Peterkaempfera bronchialis]